MSDPIWITEKDVVQVLSLPEAIEALRDGLKEEAADRASNMLKTHAIWGGHSTLHAIGAVFEGWGYAGTKTWAHTERGAMPLLILFDTNDGSVRAVIEAFALGQMRTGAISGVATDVMAKPEAKRMAMIGAGKQSLAQIAAVAAVRSLDGVAIWSPTADKREQVASNAKDVLGIEVIAAPTLEEAIDGAQVVTLATRATSPFLKSAMLPSGVHLNAVGAITPERAEFEFSMLDRAALIAADSVPQVRNLSREFADAFGDDEGKWSHVTALSRLVADGKHRPDDADLTIFKAMGMGISDLSLARAVFESAQARGLGAALPKPRSAAPRLTIRKMQEK